ncbi:SDR family oxidoreductase [Brevundimonas sp.]|uniref:SDR family oxidoreductase n=1 Tax=Brevundimonas sp. TaxID=1871086 RepID=UPI0028A0AAF6|nr:SDR family oxidoreductase [Brevundimonas sp.]
MPVIVVTGASAGIGLAIAERFAQAGWQVVVIARQAKRLAEAVERLERSGGRATGIAGDVSNPEFVEQVGRDVTEAFGGIDVWVNNAMSTVIGRDEDLTDADYRRVAETTYLSQVYGTRAALRAMRPKDQGAVIQISSGLALRPAPLQAAYCGAKAAVDGFTQAIRAELIAASSNVTLTTVYLPAVNTPQPLWSRNRTDRAQVIPDPLFDPRLCAEAVWSAVQNPSRNIYVGRLTWLMALAQRLAPALADRKAADMIAAQQGEPQLPRLGNLDQPEEGPAAIDGPKAERVIKPWIGFVSSRQTAALKVVALGVFTGLAMTTGFAIGFSKR